VPGEQSLEEFQKLGALRKIRKKQRALLIRLEAPRKQLLESPRPECVEGGEHEGIRQMKLQETNVTF